MDLNRHLHISPFLQYLRFERRYAVSTIRAYQDDLCFFFDFQEERLGKMPLPPDITGYMVRDWLVSLKEKGMEAVTLNRKLSALRAFFKFCLREGTISSTPMGKVVAPRKGKKLPVYVEEKHIELLFKHQEFPEGFAGQTEYLALSLLYQTGLRREELIELKEKSINAANNTIRVFGKGSKERIIPVDKALVQAIILYMAEKRKQFENPEQGCLLVTEKGKKLYPSWVYRMVKKHLSAVTTLKKKSPHILRHSFATHLTNAGAPLNAVKELLGHSSLAATQVYTHNSIERLRDVHKKAHPKG